MTSVFLVQHVHEADDGTEDVKTVGVYSSRAAAAAAVERLSRRPGFAVAADGFHIDEYRLDQDQWAEGFVTVSG